MLVFLKKRLQIRKKKQNPSALLKPKQYFYSRKQIWIICVYMLLILTASPWWNCHHHHYVLQRSVSLSHIVIFSSTICLVAQKILKYSSIKELYIYLSHRLGAHLVCHYEIYKLKVISFNLLICVLFHHFVLIEVLKQSKILTILLLLCFFFFFLFNNMFF